MGFRYHTNGRPACVSRFFTSIRTCASAARARARRASANRIGMAVAGQPTFCAPVDRRNLLSVLGIVTTQQTNYRQAIRDSWMRHGEASSVTKLVMRGLGASKQLLREAAAYRDIVFLPERERQPKASGPLISTLLWLSCAVVAWPNAALVGKSEDDVWLHLPDIYDSLRGSMAALRARGVDHLYWGLMEYYHFNESSGRPINWLRPSVGWQDTARGVADQMSPKALDGAVRVRQRRVVLSFAGRCPAPCR